jgi:curved DNA-binding protein CbpA
MLENAPLDEIKQQYRSLSLELHPDKNPGIDPLEFKRLAAAFKKLSDNSNKRI